MPLITLDPSALTVQQRQRATRQFGRYLQLVDGQGAPRDATAGEIKGAMVRFFASVVEGNEFEELLAAAVRTPFDASV